jgi:hypothetical protein
MEVSVSSSAWYLCSQHAAGVMHAPLECDRSKSGILEDVCLENYHAAGTWCQGDGGLQGMSRLIILGNPSYEAQIMSITEERKDWRASSTVFKDEMTMFSLRHYFRLTKRILIVQSVVKDRPRMTCSCEHQCITRASGMPN